MTQGAARATSRMSDLYDPTARFEVQAHDVEYRHDGARSWQTTVYQPQGSGPFPAVLEIHGGAWNRADRFQNEPANRGLAASGIVVAAFDFRLGKEGAYPNSLADVNLATRWLKHHATDFNATAQALGIVGYSSGGHMAMLSAMRPNDPRHASHPLDVAPDLDASVSYVIIGWPVLDPYARYHHAKAQGKADLLEAHHNYFVDEATMQDANPQLILERGETVELPPTLLVQGAEDDVLAPHTAERFVEAYGKASGVIELALYPGAGHGYSRDPGPNTARTLDTMKWFIARQLQAIDAGW